MDEWRKVKLKDICLNITDGKHGDCKNQESSGYYFVSCKDVVDGVINYSGARQITKDDFEETDKRTNLEPNDILITNSGTIGRMALVKDIPETRRTTFQKSVAIVKPNKELVCPQYLYYVLLNRVSDFVNRSNGAAQKNLLLSTMRDFELNIVPSLEVQRGIAGRLGRYDGLIGNLRRQVGLLEEAAQRTFREWFGGRGGGLGVAPSGAGDGLRGERKAVRLADVFSFVRGKSYSSKELSDEGTLMVNLKNINPFGGYKRDAEKHFIGEYKEEQTLHKGDLVMGVTDMTQERRLVGSVALIPDLEEPVTFSMDLIKIIPYEVSKEYLYCAMRFGGLSRRIAPLANGVNVLHLKPESMMDLEIMIPDKETDKKFSEYISKINTEIWNLQTQISLLTEARDRLLPRLMAGEGLGTFREAEFNRGKVSESSGT